ncbi:MAG: Molybdenum cofactor guanylyltransferase [Pseudomonadota bacterium]
MTGLVLAGGLGSRMGGVDKGLQTLQGRPLAWHSLQRLQAQTHPLQQLAINANRHLDTYQTWGVPVWPDTLADHPGPLAGFLTGLSHCQTPYLLTVPCDTPDFPLDLLARLWAALQAQNADMAMALAPDAEGVPRRQPVFCLLKTSLQPHLAHFLAQGGRKIGAWTDQHRCAQVVFDQPTDTPLAFANLNTLADLETLALVTPHAPL